MNLLLSDQFAEVRQRLAWGVELYDPIREVIARGPTVRSETPTLDGFTAHASGRFSITYGRLLPATLQFLASDVARRFVPRRLSIDLATEAVLDAVGANDATLRLSRTGRRITLSAGAMYPIPTGSTVLRGRVERNGAPERWARIEVAVPSLAAGTLARATTDDDGEFVAVLPPIGGSFAFPVPGSPVTATIGIAARDVLPDRQVVDPDELDPYWDLPVETLPSFGTAGTPPTDDVADGIADSVGLRASTTGPHDRAFRIGKVTPIPAVTFT